MPYVKPREIETTLLFRERRRTKRKKKKSVLVFSSGRPSWFRVTSKFGIKFLTLQRDHNAELVVLKVSCEL
jgi:hypothetical protein